MLFFGAGASVEYKAPSTEKITIDIEQEVLRESCGVREAFMTIKDRLSEYLERPANFEEIYHCAHELIATFPPTNGASEEFRPRLVPFIKRTFTVTKEDLFKLCAWGVVEVIRERFSACCDSNSLSLKPLTSFINGMKGEYITRVYIPRSRHDPKILWVDGAEIVGDRITKVRPIPRNLFTQKTERRIGELGTSCVALVVSDVSVHEAP